MCRCVVVLLSVMLVGVLSTSPALGWSITWLDVTAANLNFRAEAEAHYGMGQDVYRSDAWSDSYPGTSLPLGGGVLADAGVASADGYGVVTERSIWTYVGLYQSWAHPYESAQAEIESSGMLRRTFRIDGGTGSTEVSIPVVFEDHSLDTRGGWTAGVCGQGSWIEGWLTDGMQTGYWVGTLTYGVAYEFEGRVNAHAFTMWPGDVVNSTLELTFGTPATPVPEPSAFALLGLGLVGWIAVRRFRS